MKVAEKDGRVVGYLVHAPISESTEEVYSFYVDPAELGKGMGWALWQNMTAEARASGRSHVELWVLEGNRLGISWYERHAGAVVGRQQIDLPDGPHSELRYRFDLP
jgi:ribosomal protein S18 acetylase RimI-like enzyme